MPTLTQIEDHESLALSALRKVLASTDNPNIITKAANAILRYCAQLRREQHAPTSPSQSEGAGVRGARAMSTEVIQASSPIPTPSPSPNPFSDLLTKQEVAQLRHLMPTLPMNQILDPAMVKRWRRELARIAPNPKPTPHRPIIPDSPHPAPDPDPPR